MASIQGKRQYDLSGELHAEARPRLQVLKNLLGTLSL